MNDPRHARFSRRVHAPTNPWENSATHYMLKVLNFLDAAFPIFFHPNTSDSFLPQPQLIYDETIQRQIDEVFRRAKHSSSAKMRYLVLNYAVERKLPTAWVCGRDMMADMTLMPFQQAGVAFERLTTGEWDEGDFSRVLHTNTAICISPLRMMHWKDLIGGQAAERIHHLADKRGIRHFICESSPASAELKSVLQSLRAEQETPFVLVECS